MCKLQEQEADSSFSLSLLLPECAMRPICASWCISGGDGFVYTCGILPMKGELLLFPPGPKQTEGFPRVALELGGRGQRAWFGVLRGQKPCFEAAVSQSCPQIPKACGTCIPLPCPPQQSLHRPLLLHKMLLICFKSSLCLAGGLSPSWGPPALPQSSLHSLMCGSSKGDLAASTPAAFTPFILGVAFAGEL